LLYRHIGRSIKEFPDMKGFSPRNLKYMRAFAEAYRDETIVQEVLAQITWYHNAGEGRARVVVRELIEDPVV